MTRIPELGRLCGHFIPVAEVELHLANGWELLDDMAGSMFARDEVLMAPPAALEEEAA
jgi:hypothetical protein